ncbi:MAG: FAD-dependent oxidoreductase [Gammaproteobacteria bacterium]|nr:FAD-dependent oxidoreductase [Gammaproteobacteria bacterium]
MSDDLTRRDLLQALAGGTLVAASTMLPITAVAQQFNRGSGRGPIADATGSRTPATLRGDQVVQPERALPVLHTTDVLVVGGGPAGTAAALAARRQGVEVTLVERYGHLGGLATGGLVLAIFPLYGSDRRQVILGIGEEMMRRLDTLKFGIIERNKAPEYPIVDAEAFKYVLASMVIEAGLKVFLNCWGVDAIIDSTGAVRGAVFESKSGRQAILAKVVVDASGDGDIYAAAGAAYTRVKDNIGLVSRIGNIDEIDMTGGDEHLAAASGQPVTPRRPTRGAPTMTLDGKVGSPTPAPHTNWLNMMGPVGDALDIAQMTEFELKHRIAIWNNVERVRAKAGNEQAFVLETAPQLGVRLSRLLHGVTVLTAEQARAQTKFEDAIGYSGSYAGQPEFQIPYRALVPQKVENLLAAGRCIATDFPLADTTRLIPVCWVTGEAAGVAASLCVTDRCTPRTVEVAKLTSILRAQGAYLG